MLPIWVDVSVSTPTDMFLGEFMTVTFAVMIGKLPNEKMDDGRFLLIFLGGFFLILAYVLVSYWQWKRERALKQEAS